MGKQNVRAEKVYPGNGFPFFVPKAVYRVSSNISFLRFLGHRERLITFFDELLHLTFQGNLANPFDFKPVEDFVTRNSFPQVFCSVTVDQICLDFRCVRVQT